MKKTLLWILTLLNASTIFFFSSQNSNKSNGISKEITSEIIVKSEQIKHSATTVTKNEFSAIHDIVRSSAHFTLFLILAVFVYLLLKEYPIKYTKLLCVGICVFYALTDEFHQLFVNGRAFELIDLTKDWSGSIIGMCLAVFAMFILKKLRHTSLN